MGRGTRRQRSPAGNPAGTAAGALPQTPSEEARTRVDAANPSGEHREPAWNYGTLTSSRRLRLDPCPLADR